MKSYTDIMITTYEKNQEIIKNILSDYSKNNFLKGNHSTNLLFLQDYYSDMSLKEIGIKYNIQPITIQKRIKNLNYPNKKSLNLHKKNFKTNEDYFNIIDNKDKSYWLGLMYADGFISRGKNVKRIGISLNDKDKYLLENFRETLNLISPLIRESSKNQHRLLVSSGIMFDNLNNLGCIENKSLILKFPTEEQVPKELIRHFIRGYFDGDGCICVYGKYNYKTLSFAGTNHFLQGIKNNIKLFLNIERGNIKKVQNIYILSYSTKEDIKKIYNFFYDDATIYLQRKHDKFLI